MNKFKLTLSSGLVVEHFGWDSEAAKEYVEKRFGQEVMKIQDVTVDNKGALVYFKGGWFGVDED